MTTDVVMDAMEYIDDAYLAAVDALRMQKMTPSPMETGHRHTWTWWAAIAACLLLLIGGGWRIALITGSDGAAMEDAAENTPQNAAQTYTVMALTYGGRTVEITEGETIAVVCDILVSAFEDGTTINADIEWDGGLEDGITQDRYGYVGSYQITLCTEDGRETVYRLKGSAVQNTETGVIVRLTEEAVAALMTVLDET